MGQLAEQHRDQLRPAAKAFGAPFSVVFVDQRSEFGSGRMLEQLIEETGYLYDWSALQLGFGARIGTSPTNRCLPRSIVGGLSLEPAIGALNSKPVLDKSVFRGTSDDPSESYSGED